MHIHPPVKMFKIAICIVWVNYVKHPDDDIDYCCFFVYKTEEERDTQRDKGYEEQGKGELEEKQVADYSARLSHCFSTDYHFLILL